MLFASSEAVHCYATHCMLTQDTVYFKMKGNDVWEPRPAEQVWKPSHNSTGIGAKSANQRESV
eukprot:762882-Prorocentrum_minimum.AAC.1